MPLLTPNPERPDETYRVWGVCGLVVAAIALVYGPTLKYGLLDYDDNAFVYENTHVRAGLTVDGIRWALVSGPGGEWYPLAMLSHMLDCQLFGLKGWGHHLTGVLLHAATSIALVLVLRRMTGELTLSGLVALVFAIHPQHVESVAWVAERRDTLSGLFFVLTLGAYLGYVRHGRSPARYLVLAAMLTLSLMAKATAVTLPPLLLLLDYWPLGRWREASDQAHTDPPPDRAGLGWLIVEKLPLVALSIGACAMTLLTHTRPPTGLPIALRIEGAPIACVQYILQFFFPARLAVFYPYPAVGWPSWQVAGATAILVTVSVVAIVLRRRCPYLLVGWFWFLGMLVPVLGLIQVSSQAMADRYTYLPSIGLSIAVVWGLAGWGADSANRRWALTWGAAAAMAALTACAMRQTTFWRDEEALWRHALAVTEENSEAEVGLADALRRKDRLEEAIAHYRAAVKLPCETGAHNNFGAALIRQGKLDEAIVEFQEALKLDPDSARAHANLGATLGALKKWSQAEQHLRRAIELDPSVATTHFDLAHVLMQSDNPTEAVEQFEAAIAIDPANPVFHNDLAISLAKLGQSQRAIDEFAAAVKLAPGFLPARLNLARALHEAGRNDEAVDQCRQVLQIDFSNAAARQMLGQFLSGQARPTSPSLPDPK